MYEGSLSIAPIHRRLACLTKLFHSCSEISTNNSSLSSSNNISYLCTLTIMHWRIIFRKRLSPPEITNVGKLQ
ncbi:unnamed protein product [Prunus brigantina]